MPSPQRMFDLIALSRWDGEGGAGPSLPRRSMTTTPNTTAAEATAQWHESMSGASQTKPCVRMNKLSFAPKEGIARERTAMPPIRVMVIEDDPHIGLLFGEVLEGLGYVVCAIEATEASAVDAALRFKPDLMLVDIHLGVGSGILAVEEILRNGFIPHVFCGGDISGILTSQPTAIALQKPFRVSALARSIKLALGGSAQCT
ncbi:MAG: response regulator [Hyphomicrobiaceae bacterium]